MQTTMMRANMTAYSTAVGPSSRFRNVTMLFNMKVAPRLRFWTIQMVERTDRRDWPGDPRFHMIAQLPAGRALSTVVKVALARWPRIVIEPMQTTMMRANMTAYSTAVGPSSRFRNVTMLFNMIHTPG